MLELPKATEAIASARQESVRTKCVGLVLYLFGTDRNNIGLLISRSWVIRQFIPDIS